MQDRTDEGYVFRVDLRLRPDPVLDAAGGAGGGGAGVLRERRPELGAGGVHQGPRRARATCARRGLPGRAHALRLAAQPRLRRHRRHPFDQAPDPRRCRPDERLAAPGARPEAGRRRHPRDRVLRPDPAADPGRPPPRACAAAARWRRWPRSPPPAMSPPRSPRNWPRPTATCARLEHRVQMIADEQTHRLPEDDARAAAGGGALRRGDLRRFDAAVARTLKRGQPPLRRAVRRRGAAVVALRQPGVHRRRGRPADAGDADAHGLFQRRTASPRRCAPGTTATSPPPAASAAASSSPASRRGCWKRPRRPARRTRPSTASPTSSRACPSGGAGAVAVPGAAEAAGADRAGDGLRAAVRAHPGPPARGAGRAARSGLLRPLRAARARRRRRSRGAEGFEAAMDAARAAAPRAGVPDRAAGAGRHGERGGGRRGLRRSGRRLHRRPRRGGAGARSSARPARSRARSRWWRWASAARAR